jgi:hypothetical protein
LFGLPQYRHGTVKLHHQIEICALHARHTQVGWNVPSPSERIHFIIATPAPSETTMKNTTPGLALLCCLLTLTQPAVQAATAETKIAEFMYSTAS